MPSRRPSSPRPAVTRSPARRPSPSTARLGWAIRRGAPADLAGEVVPLYWELAPPLGVRPEVALAQAMVETANFTFPRREHTVSPEHRNPCGMRTRVIVKGPQR